MQFPKKPYQITTSFFLFILVCVFLLDACDRGRQSQPSPRPPEVVTMTVKEQQVVLTSELAGRTSAYLVAEVRPQVSGIIQKRMFTEGSGVKAGAVLYQIDPALFQAAYDSAAASLARAEANLPAIRSRAERYRELLVAKAVSQQDFDDADSAFRQVKAEVSYWKAVVESARINLGYTRVTAPISGRIGRSNVTKGALVTAHQPAPLATIQQLDPIYVDVPQSTTEMLRLKRNLDGGHLDQNGASQKKVKLILEDGTAYPLNGTLQFRGVTVDPTTGSIILRVIFPNPEDVLLPGMFVRAVMEEGVDEQAILVPQEAVSRDPKGNPVSLIVDTEDKVRQRMLTIDRAIGDKWFVSSGLAQGDRVIVEGIQKVRPGTLVKVVSFEAGRKENSGEHKNTARPTAESN